MTQNGGAFHHNETSGQLPTGYIHMTLVNLRTWRSVLSKQLATLYLDNGILLLALSGRGYSKY